MRSRNRGCASASRIRCSRDAGITVSVKTFAPRISPARRPPLCFPFRPKAVEWVPLESPAVRGAWPKSSDACLARASTIVVSKLGIYATGSIDHWLQLTSSTSKPKLRSIQFSKHAYRVAPKNEVYDRSRLSNPRLLDYYLRLPSVLIRINDWNK